MHTSLKLLCTVLVMVVAMSTAQSETSEVTAIHADQQDTVILALATTAASIAAPTALQPQPLSQNSHGLPTTYSGTNATLIALPNLTTPIVDTAKVLLPEQYLRLSEKLHNLYNQGIAQIGIVIVPTTGIEDIFSYSMRVADSWKLGTAKLDNGLLIVVAINDRKIQILTGYGLEGVVPDLIAKRIIDSHITPHFKVGNYYQGLSDGIAALDTRLQQDPEHRKQADAQAQYLQQQQAAAAQLNTTLLLMFTGLVVLSLLVRPILGRFISSTGLGVVGAVAAIFMGLPVFSALLYGLVLVVVLLVGIGNIVANAIILGGNSRGGGFSGGGGGFGGGGASGSW